MKHSEMPQAWQDHDASIRPYLRAHLIVNLTHKILNWALLFVFIFTAMGREWEWMMNGEIKSKLLKWLLYMAAAGGLFGLLGLPFSIAGWQVERRFGLSKQGWKSWLSDQLKGAALGIIIGTIILSALFFIVQQFGDSWWLAASVFFFAFSVLLAQLAPLIIPLFFKLKPMTASPLKEKLFALCASHGVTVEDIFHLGLGEKTEKGNAAFVGLGKTKKILIGDTLYEKYPEEQIEAVFAHELGHQVNNDIWKNIFLSGFLTFFVFWAANALCQSWAFDYLGTSMERPFGLFVFFTVFSICQLPMGFAMVLFSRQRERMADKFADKLNRSTPLAKALEALTRQNKGLFRPNPIVEFFKYSHPAPWRRIHPRLYS